MKRSAAVTLVLLGASTAAAYGQSNNNYYGQSGYDYYCDPYGLYDDYCSSYYWGRHGRHHRRGGFGKSGHWHSAGG
jgi:hypothetical protein